MILENLFELLVLSFCTHVNSSEMSEKLSLICGLKNEKKNYTNQLLKFFTKMFQNLICISGIYSKYINLTGEQPMYCMNHDLFLNAMLVT